MADEQEMLQFVNLTSYVYVRKQREVLPRNNPFESYDNDEFKRRFRISKLAVQKLLEQVCNCALLIVNSLQNHQLTEPQIIT
jgi:hypothetical protein